ncbi:MAG: glycoside hydrolase family 3 C-terminal domain-containing protein [Paramuribaculum sp.]|nr:glycoside hydrolase family 3 C-terminal domain-containing protein [Paramuribaculum sp.]
MWISSRNFIKAAAYMVINLSFLLAPLSADAKAPLYKDSSQPIEARVSDLLGRMTLDEKIGQTNQRSVATGMQDLGDWIPLFKQGLIGSIMNVSSPEVADSLQSLMLNDTRLGIPLIIARDVIHGYKTIFPIPLGQAATFNPGLANKCARVAAIEASADGIRWTFAPMLDIARDARWGRIAESCGEDPYLTALMGRAMVEGFQGGLAGDPTSLAACAKHFVAYGAAEGGRDYNSTYIPERLLRQIYLPPFRQAIDAGALTVMASFNENDGLPVSANRHLLTDILRDEWGFSGCVVSDCFAVRELISHGVAEDEADASRISMNAGLDMEMESGHYLQHMRRLIETGKVSEARIDSAVSAILYTKFALGLFDDPFVHTPQCVKYAPEHLDAARQAALQSAILLKNNNALPLDPKRHKRVLLTGPLADASYDQLGTWIFDGEKEHTLTLRQGLDSLCRKKGMQLDYVESLGYTRHNNPQGIEDAEKSALQSDVIVVAVGEEAIFSGEAHCMASLDRVGHQSELVERLAATGKPVVMVVMAGRPLTIKREIDCADAVLYAFHPGTMGGVALAELLTGVVSPSGKTPVTFPLVAGQEPIYYNHTNTGRPANGTEIRLDGIPEDAGNTFLGGTSYYLDAGHRPMFPFGFGLSYGKFEYSDLQLSADAYLADDTIKASVTITNSGDMDATEVVQLYVRDHVATVARPIKELKRFTRVTLGKGQSRTIEFELPVSELAYVGTDLQCRLDPGVFTLFVGGDSENCLSSPFSVR